MEGNLKNIRVEYISNHYPDLAKILYLSWGDQTKIKIDENKDDNLKILKVEYLMTNISLGKLIRNPNGKPRVILECGPAQPSLSGIFWYFLCIVKC